MTFCPDPDGDPVILEFQDGILAGIAVRHRIPVAKV
jgi:hypothetical protein